MRGIEAALKILTSSELNTGAFASESLRKLADREHMKAPDITLASSLIYIVMRRKELWQKIAGKFIRAHEKLPDEVYMSMIIGTGGLTELRRFSKGVLINGIVEHLRKSKSLIKYAGLVNAVLRKVSENGEDILNEIKTSNVTEEKALYAGVPVWSLPAWLRTWSRSELVELFGMMTQPAYASLRVSPGNEDEMMNILNEHEIRAYPSDVSSALRLNQSILPANVPGFNEGKCTVQSESSIIAASIVKRFYSDGMILDMCSGRGVKAGQILQENESASLECWELSEKRGASAERELLRLNVTDRAKLKTGDALTLEPENIPSFVVLDAPCSCSGTWNRKPESKWRLDWKKLDALVITQKKLLERALSLCKSGGHVLYITCSLLKQENENVVAEVLANHSDCTEISTLIDVKGNEFRRGKPYGLYIMPLNSWLDGFYCSLIMKR